VGHCYDTGVVLALDAMRKAHEVEVQKEIEKFKAQYLEKLKASPDVRQLRRDHECVQ
jgi:hypothetical protein